MSLALVSIALTVMIAALPVARAFTFQESVGETKISSLGVCSGGVVQTPQDGTDWTLAFNPDTVRVPYNVSWNDSRIGSGLTNAYHNFTLVAEHLSLPAGSAEKRVITTGNGGSNPSGYVVLWVNVTNVYRGQYVNVTFTASLHLAGATGCPIDASQTRHYHFV